MKKEYRTINATPEKRLFWSIISDYNLKTALCELIDNAYDLWSKGNRKKELTVNINVDFERQFIQVVDNAGGVREEFLKHLVSPGGSSGDPTDVQIGFFGVGTKRAVVALAEEIKILSRHSNRDTFQIDISKEWLDNPSWDIPIYKADDIDEGTTFVDLSKLRTPISEKSVEELVQHFSRTYALLIESENINFSVNGQRVSRILFDNWAFPPEFGPRTYVMRLKTKAGELVEAEISGGLVNENKPGEEEYGVYFYCNRRLISGKIKDREVGYLSGYAGVPHSDASLSRVIVKLYGAAMHMPWNTSKSAINYAHPTFEALRELLVQTVTQYSSLSRRLNGQWEEKVFAHKTGTVLRVPVENPKEIKKLVLPELPKVRKSHLESMLVKNRSVIQEKPWTLGILEALIEVSSIRNKNYQTKNRMALILLDSTLEISFKEFIIHNEKIDLKGKSLKSIFDRRDSVIEIVREFLKIDSGTVRKISHYYSLRNKLIHERATVDVPESDIENYQRLIHKLVKQMFSVSA